MVAPPASEAKIIGTIQFYSSLILSLVVSGISTFVIISFLTTSSVSASLEEATSSTGSTGCGDGGGTTTGQSVSISDVRN